MVSIEKHGAGLISKVSVVDNASSDNSMELAQQQCRFENIEWVFNQHNLGSAAGNNQILKALEADYAILMNPDCEFA